eukprot:3990016-Pyramimonas_sp.AAC.1
MSSPSDLLHGALPPRARSAAASGPKRQKVGAAPISPNSVSGASAASTAPCSEDAFAHDREHPGAPGVRPGAP